MDLNDFNLKHGQRIIIGLTNNEIYEGDYDGGGRNRLEMINVVESTNKNPLVEAKVAEEVSPSVSEGNKILILQEEYERLKHMSLSYTYMATIDKRYVDSIEHLLSCENVGVVGLGAEFGRAKSISLLVLSSWDQVYIYDLLLYAKKVFPKELREILESHSIKKVVHDSRALVDCMSHCHKVELCNIFDTQVADIMIRRNESGVVPERKFSISECMTHYLNFPKNFLIKDKNVSDWEERPLSEGYKIEASQSATYLITLKNKCEELMMQNFYSAVELYTKSMRDLNCGGWLLDFKNSLPEEIKQLADSDLFKISTIIRLRKQNVFHFNIHRPRLVVFVTFVVVLLVLVNFLSQYIPIFRPEYRTIIKHRDVRLSKVHNVLKHELPPVTTNEKSFNQTFFNREEKCQVVHIGVVCSGPKSNIYFHTMLKSIYFYRNNPLHFHLMVNKMSEKVLKILFETWAVPQVNVTFYDLSEYVADVRWVPNSHYSGMFGLLKLVFPKVVPLSVTDKIIVLDTDVTFTSDIYSLWKLFDKFKRNQSLGLVENESDYYLKLSSTPWPALNRGFNTGVILYNLKTLQEIHWNDLWVTVTKKTVSVFGATRLADQDIINTVIKQNQDLLYQVPCEWNTQLSDYTLSYNCYSNHRVKVIHWNSPKKFNVLNKDGDYFRSIYTSFLEMNGNLFRRQLFNCDNRSQMATESYVDVCSNFRQAQNHHWRTLLFLREYKYVATKDDITFIAHLSYDRLHMIEELCQYWDGPISLTFYVTDPELEECLKFIDSSDSLQERTDIAYHAVFKDGELYPINELRNIGLRHVNTPLVFLSDIDFIPMYGLYSILKHSVVSFRGLTKKALIVPAFETQRYKTILPKNKRELLHMLKKNTIFTFRYDVWPVGHVPVNYSKWKTALLPYQVKWQADFEPYVVVNSHVTEYDRRFLGFGWNKVSHIMELEAQGYEFYVLPNVFIIHKPHAPSYDIGKFRNSPIYRMCLQNLKRDFVEKLEKKYGRVFDVKNNSFTKI